MSYQVLARKWRPRSFSTLVGQEHVVRALTHALNENRLHHAYLFTGTRGVGKTTIARILAKCLNCEAGVSATPCGQCSACREIDAGRFVDLLEVDAATNTRVEEMRQLLENAIYAPTRGRYKVYVIDEVHMLSNSAFNAMLKTLEEPPEHVKFILATTDPQKIPVTVLSRCLQFNLKQMPIPAITGHLAHILEEEAIPFEEPALALVARAASGSMRDALSILDQAIAHGAGKVEQRQVEDMLGTVDQGYLFDLLEALAKADGPRLAAIAADMQSRSLSPANALQELAALLTRLQLVQLAGPVENESGRLVALAACFSPEFTQLAYQIAVQGRAELPLAPDEHSGFLMVLMRLLAFCPLSWQSAAGCAGQGSPRPEASAQKRAAPMQQPAARPQAPPAPSPPQAPPPAACDAAAPGSGSAWAKLAASLKLSAMAKQLAQQCDLASQDDGLIVLNLPPAHQHLKTPEAVAKLGQALQEALGQPVRLRVDIAEAQQATPAEQARQAARRRQDAAVETIQNDAFVQQAVRELDATIVEDSIQPID